MRLEDKTYGLNFIIVAQLQIELQLEIFFPICFASVFYFVNYISI